MPREEYAPGTPLPWQVEAFLAKVPVCSGIQVDRPKEIEVTYNRRGSQVERLEDCALNRSAVDRLGLEGVDHQRHRMRNADCVRNLHLGAIGKTCCHDVLRYPAHRVAGGTIDLRGILAGEGSAPMA